MKASFHTTTTRCARKQHRCEECGCTIVPGEKYQAYAGVWDGQWGSGKQCLACKSASDYLFSILDKYADGYVIGELSADLMEYARGGNDDEALMHANGIDKRSEGISDTEKSGRSIQALLPNITMIEAQLMETTAEWNKYRALLAKRTEAIRNAFVAGYMAGIDCMDDSDTKAASTAKLRADEYVQTLSATEQEKSE